MWQPTVSVVMCTYNGEEFLREQMDSIVAQTYPITEFLIFDDASTDKTAEIIEEYQHQYPFISFKKNTGNLGYNLNFQKALKAATAEVIAIADQDDVWHTQKIEKMLAHWSSTAPLIHCDSQRFSGQVPQVNRYKHLYNRFQGTKTRQLFVYNSVSGHAALIRRSFLSLVLPLQKDIYYDWWCAVVASCNGGVDFVDEVLVYQRVHENNVSLYKNITRKNQTIAFRTETIRHLNKFLTAPNLSIADKEMGEKLFKAMNNLHSFRSRFKLFTTLLKYRNTIFYTKRRKILLFSHVKHAFRFAFH